MNLSPKIYDLSDRKDMFYWQTNRKISPKEQKDIFLDRHRNVKKEDAIHAIEYGMKQSGRSSTQVKVIEIGNPIAFGSVNSVLKAKLSGGLEVMIRMHPYYVRNGYFWAESVATKEAKNMGVPA